MIGYVSGKVIYSSENTVLLECGGIGYEINCSVAAYSKLMQNREGGVYTYLQVKEDGIALYGFATIDEKNMFLKLISVSGVGAKMGITLLGGMSLNDLAVAIAASDVKKLSSIKGLGKKTAERIIVELRESVGKGTVKKSEIFQISASSSQDADNAITALISLGYQKSVALQAVNNALMQGAGTIEDIIAFALRSLD
ncbi:MAG: Holliday junction branch migration protein RuvA [Clostridia bacterium]|nr:Holliday junction branch migration protein RuvA [Clostridia bacterium]